MPAFPTALGFGQTRAARGADRRWIDRRPAEGCAEVGSRVAPQGDWLGVLPA